MLPDPSEFTIGGRSIGGHAPLFVIAEIGLNHGGSVDRALDLVDAAADAGADAIKLQTIVADRLVAPDCPAPMHVQAASLVDFFSTFELDAAGHRRIVDRARNRGLAVMATPFSRPSVELLRSLEIDAYKVASGDLTWPHLIAMCAAAGKPLVLSTGMSTLNEVLRAVRVARAAGVEHLALLHCVSAYPVPSGSENLRAIQTLAGACHVPVGLSDHSADTFSVPIAVSLGAALYERHLVLSGDRDAIDRAVSSTPDELADAVRVARRTEAALGTGRKICLEAEAGNRVASRRSLFAIRSLPAGATVTPNDFVALRPATGLSPASLPGLTGLRLIRPIAAGQPVTGDAFAPTAPQERHVRAV